MPGGEGKTRRRTPTPRTWPTETAYTGRIQARVPLRIRDRVRQYAETTGQTTTDIVVTALIEYLQRRGW